jgi:hypothetical protein
MPHGGFFRKILALRGKQGRVPGLPFAEILSESRLLGLLQEYGVSYRDRVFSPCVTLWTFLSQVLSTDHSCNTAVARLLAYRASTGQASCSADNSSYCQARQRLPEALLPRLVRETGKDVQQQAPAAWLKHGRRVKIVDGSTASMPDTPDNTAAFGKPKNQRGVSSFPVVRILVVLCLATGVVLEAALGRYQGKHQSELALFRSLSDTFTPGDVLLGDRLFCTYCDMARLKSKGIDCVFRLHAHRRVDFRRGRRLGHEDHVVVWSRPTKCPDWMAADEFAALPATMRLREIRIRVQTPGFRSHSLILVTTLTDPEQFTKDDIATLFRQRWHAELDLRSLKTVMQMDVLRCKKAIMVRKEIWAHFLAYNLLRSVMCATAEDQDVLVGEISFKGTLQLLNELYQVVLCATSDQLKNLCERLFRAAAQHRVGNRPDRYEPRKRKRPAKPFPRLKFSRAEERKRCA